MTSGKAIIFSAPSGSGKTTIVQQLLQNMPQLGFSISATTRQSRANEKHGIHYYFYSPDEFRQLINDDALIEWEEVYQDKYYGTLKNEVQRIWKKGQHVIFDVDVKGGLKLKEYFNKKALAIFIKVPSFEILKERLEKRKSESQTSLQERLNKAASENEYASEFDRVIINDDLSKAIAEAKKTVVDFISN